MPNGETNVSQNQNSEEFALFKEEIEGFRRYLDELNNQDAINTQRFDELSQKLVALDEAAQLLESRRNDEMNQAAQDIQSMYEQYEGLKQQLEAVVAELNMLRAPPHGRVSFVRFVRLEKIEDSQEGEGSDDNEEISFPVIDVRNDRGDFSRVYIVGDINPELLRYGQYLITNQPGGAGHVIEALDEFSIEGTEATVAEVLTSDREGVRVSLSEGERDTKIIAHCADEVDTSSLEEGTRVLVDRRTNLIFEVLSQEESMQFAVDEMSTTTFEDIGGYDELKGRVRHELAWPVLYRDAYERIDREQPKGIILSGPPGLGKTMIAKAIFTDMNKLLRGDSDVSDEDLRGHFLHVKGPELQHWFVGRTEYEMRALFEQAKRLSSPTKPVIIFFDEAESLFPTRGSGISSDVERTNVPQFTSLVDGLEERGNVFLILATNRIDMLDRAVIRPGRLDRIVRISRPSWDGARDIFAKYLKPEWGHIHPKYDEDIYTPTDRHGTPRTDDNNKTVKEIFRNDPQKVCDYLINRAVSRMYDTSGTKNLFVKIKFAEEKEWKHFRYADFISGAMIENIVDRAKDLAIKRHINEDDELGIMTRDLFEAIEEVFSELRSPSTLGEFHNWLAIEGIGADRRIEDFTFFTPDDTLDEED